MMPTTKETSNSGLAPTAEAGVDGQKTVLTAKTIPAADEIGIGTGLSTMLFYAFKLRINAIATASMAESEIIVLRARQRLAYSQAETEAVERDLIVQREIFRRNLDLEATLADHELGMGRRELELGRLALESEELRKRRLELVEPHKTTLTGSPSGQVFTTADGAKTIGSIK